MQEREGERERARETEEREISRETVCDAVRAIGLGFRMED